MAGIPTMVITRQGFTQAVGNAFAGLGFPAEGPSVYEFPTQMFNVGSDLTPINENVDKIVYGLTKWQPKITTKGIVKPDMVTVQGKDYQNALDNLNALFLKNSWGDALPVVAPTADRVKWVLTGTDLAPDTVISPKGGVMPRGGIATVEQIAVAVAMAGGRPEYLPIVIAAVQAITDPKMTMQSWNATTQDVFPALIINGPIAKQIRVGSGYGIMGPDPFHPAGQAIGRAVRLVQQNLGGAIPGVGTMATYSAGRTTNAVFAEDEDGLPKGWNSFAVDRGFKKEQNILTVTLVNSFTQNGNTAFGTKEANDQTLMKTAKLMGAPNNHRWSNQVRWNEKNPDLVSGVIFLPRGTAASMADVSGYSKLDVKTFLWKNSKMTWADAIATGQGETVKGLGLPEGQDVPVAPKPEQITLIVAGGDQSGHSYWMAPCTQGDMKSLEITLPKGWDALIKQAETDLGPLPAAH